MITPVPRTPPPPRESFEYLQSGHDHLSVAHHQTSLPRRGAILIAGPLGAERERAFRTLVIFSRALADHGFDSLRFDYRGIGESTGDFSALSLADWLHDVHAGTAHLKSLSPGVPLVLLGLRAGALLVSEAFAAGLGDALMLWSPPKSGADHLQDILRRNLMADMMANPQASRRTREEIAADLTAGQSVNVDGYPWSQRLWQDAPNHTLTIPPATECRPWHVVDFKGLPPTNIGEAMQVHRTTITTERFWESSPLLIPQSSVLYDSTLPLVASLCGSEALRT